MEPESLKSLVETAFNGLVTLTAAFAGSWWAFRLSDNAKARETVAGQVAAVNRAQFTLIQQYNALKIFQRKSIDPVRSDQEHYLTMRPTLPLPALSSAIDLNGLSFLLETDDRELLFHLMIEGQRFETTRAAINERSRLHIEEVQPRLTREALTDETALIRVLGERLFLTIRGATNEVVREVDLTVTSTMELSTKFHSAMKRRYPKHSIIRFEPDDAA